MYTKSKELGPVWGIAKIAFFVFIVISMRISHIIAHSSGTCKFTALHSEHHWENIISFFVVVMISVKLLNKNLLDQEFLMGMFY